MHDSQVLQNIRIKMMKQRIIQSFNKGAKTYHLADNLQKKVAVHLGKCLEQISAKNILEIGCGTGLFSQELVTRFPHSLLLATDISPSMLDICKNRFYGFPQVKFACMDGEELNVSSSFDLIASNMTLHWFTKINTSFTDIMNKLTSGGSFIFTMLEKNSLPEWKEICNKFDLPIPTPVFPSAQILQKDFPAIKLETVGIQQSYANIFDFLNSLKKIGAIATREDYTVLKAGTLRRVLRECNKPINISYDIIYGHYIKS